MNMSIPRTLALTLLALVCTLTPLAHGQVWPGQSSTLLPDGRVLLLGGFETKNTPGAGAWLNSGNGDQPRRLGSGLNIARAGHTATVLPDGTVFIFGGVGSDGRIVSSGELFDPSSQSFTLLTDVLAVPRAFHTATLLTDGSLLLAGGVLTGGELPDDVQLFDYRSRKALSYHALLATPRQGHSAALLADGSVRLSGGADRFGRPVTIDEIYDPISRRFHPAGQPEAADSGAAPASAGSIPADGATDASLSDPIAIRFTRLLNVTSANSQSFVLTGPNDAVVAATVTAAERGRLVFVLPQSALQPGTHYVLEITNAADQTGEVMPEAIIAFDTAGAPPDGNGLDWTPNSTWTDPNGITKFQQLPPLQAHAGVTALSGQTLKLNGWPLEHVTLEIGGKKFFTDSTGRFLITGLTAGHHVLWVDGSSANHTNAGYGSFEVGVDIVANKTNVLDYTMWMTRLDMAHAVNIASPTVGETVITNPSMPGLELHLPAGTVITDWYGKVVHQISITPVPLNKPPFPLPPGVQVPIYFTIQPGGGYISVQGAAPGTAGARLIYPNAYHLAPNTPFNFWNYDADAKGWYIYGQGKVGADGNSVIPDPSVMIYEFTGAMVGAPGDAPGIGKPAGSKAAAADPVDLSTGQFIYSKTDLSLPDVIPLALTRTYITNDGFSRTFGVGATTNFDMFMVGDTTNYIYQELILPDGGRIRFDRISPGSSWTNAMYVHASSTTGFYDAWLSPNTDPSLPGFWKLVLRDGTIYSFPMSAGSISPFCQAVVGMQDHYGNRVSYTRDNACRLTKVISPNGRSISFTYDSGNRITSATDNSGRTVQYAYDATGHLSTVTDPAGGVTTYTYDSKDRMLTIKDPRGIVYLTNQYDTFGRVIQQTNADGGIYQFNWTSTFNSTQAHYMNEGNDLRGSGCFGNNGFNRYNPGCTEGYMPLVQQVDVTDPRGYVRRIKFGSTGYMTSDTHALGQPEEQTVTYAYYADNNVQSVTDSLGRVTSFDYDQNGNLARVTRLDGTPNAVTTTFTYEPQFNHLFSVTDPLSNSKVFHYDLNGNMVSASDALNHQVTMTYNGAGLVTSATDAANQTIQFSYFGADLVGKIDPLGNATSEFRDALGRVTKIADALGQSTNMQYDALNRVQQVTDPQGHVSSYTYDPNGNPLSLTDANGHTTSYTYDVMDRRATRIDALLRQESLTYDLNGNIATATDRKGQVTAFTYDALNRVINTCFNQTMSGGVPVCESTIGYQYDLPNRRTVITDSLAGVITETFDDLGRLISEVNPQGSVTYAYDPDGRVTSKTVNGQSPFTYSYNTIGQLLTITQGAQTVQLGYDSAGRASSLTFPNGVVATYGYDSGSHLVGISYSRGQTSIGNLTYAYDALNRRVSVGGSLAATLLPASLPSATYDAANQIASWNGTSLTYDPNGNLINDGQSIYSWDARGHLVGMSGAVNAAFAYDAMGRRTAKTIGPSALGFIYDGNGITQEMSGSTVASTLWSSGSNGFVQRTDASGTLVPLMDGLGSVIALADANGNLQTQYAYDPFGNTVASGALSGNEFQYIGRENDLTGLYYMHARYYSPALMRFISEDPLGFGGGDVNLHAYSLGSPTNLRDPNGTNPFVINCAVGAAMDVSFNLIADYLSGRKTTVGDAFSLATLRYAVNGCESGIIGGLIAELFIAPLVDMAAPYVARLFSDEASLAIKNVINDICDLCFPAGTPVWTRNGKVPIENVKVGDEVLSRHTKTGELEYKRVSRLTKPHRDRLIELTVNGESSRIRPTTTHPFFVRQSAANEGEWVRALDIKVGDEILTQHRTWARVTATTPIEREETVYNFEVEDDHDYFVGTTGLLVHNLGPCGGSRELARNLEDAGFVRDAGEAAHHIVAEAHPAAAEARAVLQMEGIDINSASNGMFIQQEYHQLIHTSDYFEAVNEALLNAEPGTVNTVLSKIAAQIHAGVFPY